MERVFLMKRMFSVFFVLALAITFTFSNEASAASTSATLYTNETSKSTSRVAANQWADFSIVNTGKQNISYRIFKNGVAVTNHVYVNPGQRASTRQMAGGSRQEYSLRTYCQSSSGTGCAANFAISTH